MSRAAFNEQYFAAVRREEQAEIARDERAHRRQPSPFAMEATQDGERIASKMFYRDGAEVLPWLEERKYVAEIAEREKWAAERASKKAAEATSQGEAL